MFLNFAPDPPQIRRIITNQFIVFCAQSKYVINWTQLLWHYFCICFLPGCRQFMNSTSSAFANINENREWKLDFSTSFLASTLNEIVDEFMEWVLKSAEKLITYAINPFQLKLKKIYWLICKRFCSWFSETNFSRFLGD